MFTLNRLGLSSTLARCLSSTNIIKSPHSGVRLRTRRVACWRDGKMVLRWAAAALLMTEKNFRRIMGYKDLWMLESALGRKKASIHAGPVGVAGDASLDPFSSERPPA
jgi:hypothetical protein